MFDLHPDGNRFVLATEPQSTATTSQPPIAVFVFDFADELRRRAQR
jgi:hypothetical protein